MKKVILKLSEDDRRQLEQYQSNGSNLLRERSLAIIHCSEGKSLTWIAQALGREIHTIRSWISAYEEHGVAGLNRKFSSGRPSERKNKLKPLVEEYLGKAPSDYGFYEPTWTSQVIIAQLIKATGKKYSLSTIERLMKDMGMVFKRPKKTLPASAPGKEEKERRVIEISQQLHDWVQGGKAEIIFLDEAHFSTEPNVVRGWYKQGEPFPPRHSPKKGKHVGLWCIRYKGRQILLEER